MENCISMLTAFLLIFLFQFEFYKRIMKMMKMVSKTHIHCTFLHNKNGNYLQ